MENEQRTGRRLLLDKDNISVYHADNPKTYEFRGTRVHRGLYKTASGKTFNADINGALNIMRKSNVVSLHAIYARGKVDTPIRIRIAYSLGRKLNIKLLKRVH